MPLESGTKLGPYEIQSLLGAGGMGEVYRALDRRLDRTVAIKILAAHLSSSPELKQRLEREARAISALNHPHICQLYDIGSHNGTDYLVIEYLEGETLAQRLARGAMPFPDILKFAIAVADALAAAHRQGILHRDLKPGNIMLAPGGAKLMDFGLAKPLAMPAASTAHGTAPSFTAAPTISGASPLSPLTAAGSVVGTIQYMSPEQIEGREADARSDIFALGAVLYEMAAGKRPFAGKSQISLASAILESEPQPVSALKPETPPAFEHVVNTCLRKNPEERFQSAQDAKLELQWIAEDRASAKPAEPAPPARPSPRRERLVWAAAAVAALALGAAGGMFLWRSAAPARAIVTSINPPEKTRLNLAGDQAGPPVLSPDGASLAFTATNAEGKPQLWARGMNSADAHVLPGTEDAAFPFWSPDSRSLGFFAGGKLMTIELDGGAPQAVCDVPLGRGGAWGAGGVIVYSADPNSPLLRVSASGGSPTPLTKIDAVQHTSHRWPFFLPDGRHYLYSAINHEASKSANDAVYYAALDGGENRLLLHSQANAIYAAGFLLFARGDQLMAQALDPARGTLSGEPRAVAKGVMNDRSTWHLDASASGDGVLVFASGQSGDVQLLWMDRTGKQISTVADKPSNLIFAQVSPQGDRVALQIDAGANDVWVLDLARGVRTRLTFGPIVNFFGSWSPDGKWIVYSSTRNGRYSISRKPSDGSGAEEVLLTDDAQIQATDWSRDAKYILYMRPAGGHSEIWALPLEGERKPQLLVSRGVWSRISPNGRWLAYQSSESGSVELYVVPFGGGQGKWQVSSNGGQGPLWSADGKKLYYMTPAFDVIAVPVSEAGGALQFGAPQTLVSRVTAPNAFYDVSADGKKILMPSTVQQVSSSITVVTNFTAGLKP